MLILKDVTLTLTRDLRTLVEDFSFSLQPGMKVALIGEEGNGKSTLLKAIAEPETLHSYMEIQGEIITSGEIIGYLPQVLTQDTLQQTTRAYFDQHVDFNHFDYTDYYRLLEEMGFPEDRISESVLLGSLSGGEKIKFQLLCELLKRPTLLLLDEPSNDFDVKSVQWLEHFISELKIPVMFVSHDELLLERCANTIIHLEQLMRKRKPQHTIARLSYAQYVENREDRIIRQTQLARKEKEEYDKKMERYRQIYQRVHYEQKTVSRQAPSAAKNLKDKMHAVKAMGRRFEKEKEQLARRPDFEEAIAVRFEDSIAVPHGKVILELTLETLQAGETILSRDVRLRVTGPEKVCIIGANGAGKTTLLRHILAELQKRNVMCGYMPQEYSEMMNPEQNAIEFLTVTGTKEEHTKIRTYLGSLNFIPEEMHHPILDLSGGQRAKLYFAKMILAEAEVLVLDEPTRNLSPLSGPEIRDALRAFGGTIIAVSHDRKFIREVFERVICLDEGGLKEIPAASWYNESS
ncbi:MAG: ABC-F family ATP-binding cassette domain-containing protein [Firmicutes bacterium]|nr:ABC-F family ATP-binding cassette domain-containing protein [Bacillota bacterium]